MKLRKLGIRIDYKVVDGALEVTEIVAIGNREAFKRILKRKK